MKRTKILVVEDERIVADDIKDSLERLGYAACGIAISGEEAVKKAKEMKPDLVLMDIVLEGKMDGIEAASIISSNFDIPIVYLTAYEDENTLRRAKKTMPFGYILKPFEDRVLYSAIEIALYKHQMTRMLKESEERYRRVLENVHDAIYITTPDGFQYANPAFERLTGYKGKELYRKDSNFLSNIHSEDLELLEDKSKKQRKKPLLNNELRIISKDGKMKIVETNTVNIGKNGELKEMVIFKDITKRKKIEEELKESLERLQNTFEKTINALVSALERRDPYTAGHQKRVANLACAIAKEMGLPKEQITGIRMAGIAHDIGKIQIPTEILIKPVHLSDIEFVMIKTHPQVGFDILKEIEFPNPVAKIILQHHERVDGSGYPEGLADKNILLEAKILAVADVIEAMSSHRPYRPALGIGSALEEITKYQGSIYDSKVVEKCLKLFYEKKFKFK